MRSRLALLTLGLYLSFFFLACSKKPDQTTDATTPAATTPVETQPAPAEPKPRVKKEEPIIVPAGTVLTVRLAQAVGSKISQAGQTFTASLSNPIQVGGKTVIAAGANATGTVVDAKPLGRFKGGAALSLQLNSIGNYTVQTSSVTQTATGKGKRTAVMAGGGAALGALIGGLAGGGKGAAIGAGAGLGAGGAGAAFTGNKDIVLPAESALSFTLSQPVEVK
jgi:hypothetical protein